MTFAVAAEIGNVAGFQAALLDQGLSARSGLAAFRSAGGKIRDARWYSSWGQTATSRARAADVMAAPHDALPDASLYTRWSAGRGGQFATQVRVLVRKRGEDEVGFRNYTHVTDGPHTPGEAVRAGIDEFSANDETYEEDVIGGFPTGFYAMGPDEE